MNNGGGDNGDNGDNAFEWNEYLLVRFRWHLIIK